MDASSLLETTAEVSVAFTGFIGIFLVLAARDGRFAPVDSFVIRLIVICSIGPVFLSVLPLILDRLGLGAPMLWRVSSAVVLLTEAVVIAYLAGQLRTLRSGEGRALNYGFVSWVLATAACISNLVGWPLAPNEGLYLLTMWSVVAVAGGNFVELLFRKIL